MQETSDRVSFTLGFKLSMGDYQSLNISASYSSDVKSDETPDDAFKRVKKFVEQKVESEVDNAQREFGVNL